MTKFSIIGKCKCCTDQKEAELSFKVYGDNLEVKISDCMGSKRIELNGQDKKFLRNLLGEM